MKHIDLALQGGGSHGAITWGVLDRLLEDERLKIGAVSGTSAGAMNAVALASGLEQGGRDGARDALQAFWKANSDAARYSPIQTTWWDKWLGRTSLDHSPSYRFFEFLTQNIPPAKLNPMKINPLRDLVEKQVDFERVNHSTKIKVFITATNVRTGQAKIFRQPELSVDSIMASACLPFMFPAVEIDGEAYWDGGYIGNPALHPLVDDQDSHDLVVVQINPTYRTQLPQTSRDIVNRINEVTFNASLLKELRGVQLLMQSVDQRHGEERYRKLCLHQIHGQGDVEALTASSKLNADWGYLTNLFYTGRQWADEWLETHYDALGHHSTFDLDSLFRED